MTLPQTQLLRLLVLSTTTIGLFSFTYLASRASSPGGTRFGLKGVKRAAALRQLPFWQGIEPVVRWIGARISTALSDQWRAALDRKLVLGGDFLGLLPEELVSLTLLCALAGCAVSTLLDTTLALGAAFVALGTLAGAALPHIGLASAATERAQNISRRLPYAIDLLALCMGAGLDFPGAVRQTVDKSGRPDDPVVEEFTLILQSLQLGQTRRQALECFAQRVPVDAVVEFVGSVVQAELHGNPLAEVLQIQAEVSRRKRSVRAEELASRAGVAIMGPLFMVFVAVIILIAGPVFMRVQFSGFGR